MTPLEYIRHEREVVQERARGARTPSLRVMWLAADVKLAEGEANLRRQEAGELVALTRVSRAHACALDKSTRSA